jgi:hypothetical protein
MMVVSLGRFVGGNGRIGRGGGLVSGRKFVEAGM